MPYSPDPNTVATTNLDAYKRNLKKIIAYIGPPVKLMAVVKANAYGHGMVECARTALEAGAAWLGVAFVFEGVILRKAGITAPVLVMGPESTENLGAMLDNDITIGLTSFEMLEVLKKELNSQNTSCRVHIKVDTGMGRIGIQPDRAPELVGEAWNTPGITVEGIFSHFPEVPGFRTTRR